MFHALPSHEKHRWFSGRMLACHAGGPGSIPGRCRIVFLLFKGHKKSEDFAKTCDDMASPFVTNSIHIFFPAFILCSVKP